jgi:hypothetical protein
MHLSRQNTIARIFAGALMSIVFSSCSALRAHPDSTETPPTITSAKADCTQQQMASITAGNDAAQPFPADSMGALMAAQSRYAITIAAYHACLANH